VHHHLFHHPRLLAHHHLLIGLGDLNRPLLGGREIRLGSRPVHRVPLDTDLLVAQPHGLLDGVLDHAGVEAHPAALHLPRAHLELLFDDRNGDVPRLDLACARGPAGPGRLGPRPRLTIHGGGPLHERHGPVRPVISRVDEDQGASPANALGILLGLCLRDAVSGQRADGRLLLARYGADVVAPKAVVHQCVDHLLRFTTVIKESHHGLLHGSPPILGCPVHGALCQRAQS
jgi:hypothetical protein